MGSCARKTRNKGARRYTLRRLTCNGETLDRTGGEVIIRVDGTVAVCARGTTSIDFTRANGTWRLAPACQRVDEGARLHLVGYTADCHEHTATVVLGEKVDKP
jgi:hypothetical protein